VAGGYVYGLSSYQVSQAVIAMKPKAKEYLLTPPLVILRSGAIPPVVTDVRSGNGGVDHPQQPKL
jgi:hypothetical protein